MASGWLHHGEGFSESQCQSQPFCSLEEQQLCKSPTHHQEVSESVTNQPKLSCSHSPQSRVTPTVSL